MAAKKHKTHKTETQIPIPTLRLLCLFAAIPIRVHRCASVAKSLSRDTLTRLLDVHGLTASDLGRLLGNRTLGSAILRGDRDLSKAHILTLAERFKVSPVLFFAYVAWR